MAAKKGYFSIPTKDAKKIRARLRQGSRRSVKKRERVRDSARNAK